MIHIVDPLIQPEHDESTRCQFCDYRGKLTAEHVWPSQFRKITPGVSTVRHQLGTVGATGLNQEWLGAAFSAKVRIDCRKCNHERLKRIENDALPYFAAMAASPTGNWPLQPDAQRKVAAFALRMFAVTQYTHPSGRPVPRAHREHLASHRSPPPLVEVWAMGYGGANTDRVHTQAGASRLAGPGEPMPDRSNAYRGIMRFGHLVLEVAALTDGRAFPFLPEDDRIFLRLWPIEFDRVGIWPPSRMLDDADLAGRIANLSMNIDLLRRFV
jgi:hypothetical protein